MVNARLKHIYSVSEMEEVSRQLLMHLMGDDSTTLRWRNAKQSLLNPEQSTQLMSLLERLRDQEPLQYVLGYAWFYRRKFKVNPSVLIPRPETEELCEWILQSYKGNDGVIKLLDVGTGSGCIAITLAKENNNMAVTALDKSAAAIAVAKENAETLLAQVNWITADFLDTRLWKDMRVFDCIVSNPPYILRSEAGLLNQNVLAYEPHEALFVTDNDPLQFYKTLLQFAKLHMAPSGKIFMECHQDFAKATEKYFVDNGFFTDLKKDMSGNLRMLKAWR